MATDDSVTAQKSLPVDLGKEASSLKSRSSKMNNSPFGGLLAETGLVRPDSWPGQLGLDIPVGQPAHPGCLQTTSRLGPWSVRMDFIP